MLGKGGSGEYGALEWFEVPKGVRRTIFDCDGVVWTAVWGGSGISSK
jgi:hypothetical protein